MSKAWKVLYKIGEASGVGFTKAPSKEDAIVQFQHDHPGTQVTSVEPERDELAGLKDPKVRGFFGT